MLETHPQKAVVEKTIRDLVKKNRYSNDRLVSSVTFGFWTYLFTKKPFAAGGKTLLQIFPAKAHGLGQRAVYNELQDIKDFRNSIAHHEAICFDDTGAKNTQPVSSAILRVTCIMGWIPGGIDSGTWFSYPVGYSGRESGKIGGQSPKWKCSQVCTWSSKTSVPLQRLTETPKPWSMSMK